MGARRPSCTTQHHCTDGGGNPYEPLPDQALMGYKLRVSDWAYICWVEFDWGQDGDPHGEATVPLWDRVHARELYSHVGDDGALQSSESYEWHNLAAEPDHADVVQRLHTQLIAVVEKGLVKPMIRPARQVELTI